jgi:hypothetical protein
LDVHGSGSLRHIWETHGPGRFPFILEFYVDGEAEPSIKGTLDQQVEAAKACTQPYASLGGTRVDHDSCNFYLSVPFEVSLRVDLVANPKIGMVSLQLDYRLEDESMNGTRLVQDNNGKNGEIKLAYIPDQSLDSKTGTEIPETINSLLIKMLDTPNNNTMWAGISLRVLED